MSLSLLKVAKLLLNICLPEHLRDDISGDIEEEYLLLTEQHNAHYQYWLIEQTLLTCVHYAFTPAKLLSLALATVSISIFILMSLAIIWLSAADDFSLFIERFWQEFPQQSYTLFFEPGFWQFVPTAISEGMGFYLWIDGPAAWYSLLALLVLMKIDKHSQLSSYRYGLLSVTLMLLPYLWGTVQFLLYDISLKATGPLLATMWLTIIYMILPITFTTIKKINHKRWLNA